MPGQFRRYLWVNTGIVAASFLIFGLVFYFLSSVLSAQAEGILADRSTIAARAADTENLSRLKSAAVAAEPFQTKINALLLSRDGLIGFPQLMENMARTHSLSLGFSFTAPPVAPAPPAPGYVEFRASVEGPSASIRTFVTELESRTTRFLVNLDRVELSISGSAGQADLRGRVFFRENEVARP